MDEIDLNTHHAVVMDKLNEIDEDTDCILHKIGEDHMTSDFDSGALMGMLANKGVDPGVIAMLENCKRDGNWGDNGMLIVLFLILILGFGGNGGGFFGNRNNCAEAGIDKTIFNQSNFDILNSAINTAGARQEMAIQSLANNLNCDVNSIKSALCGLDKQLAMTNGSVINAIQSCCCNIGNQIQSTSCATQRAIENQGCMTREAINGLSFQFQTADAATRQLIQQCCCDMTNAMSAGFNAIQLREDQREIQQLRDEVQRQRENANTALILQAIQNKDAITFSGTAGATAFTGTGSLS